MKKKRNSIGFQLGFAGMLLLSRSAFAELSFRLSCRVFLQMERYLFKGFHQLVPLAVHAMQSTMLITIIICRWQKQRDA